jgi:hypothetical protein
MSTTHELDTVWKLFNLLEKLSTILFDQYYQYLMERHLEEETLHHFDEHILHLIRKQSNKHDNLNNDPK